MVKSWLTTVLMTAVVCSGSNVLASPKLGMSLPNRSGESCGAAIDAVKLDLAILLNGKDYGVTQFIHELSLMAVRFRGLTMAIPKTGQIR